MLTPRRTLLLLAGFVLFGVAYAGYAQLLGWLDGLPQLPEKMLVKGGGECRPPERSVSPTQARLIEAFGANAIETDSAHYPNQFSHPSGESLIVLASGPVPANPNSKRVELSPFSLAIFGRPKPAYLRQPGEVDEITTIHSDKAVLVFDRIIHNTTDMQAAKLVGLELVSDTDLGGKDKRSGLVHIRNNQRSADPDCALVIRTPGPVFYRDAKAVAGTPAAQEPDFMTDAPVEIVDRRNLPRPIGIASPPTAPARAEDVRTPAAVADIVAGRRAPPLTVTGIGLRVYLDPNPPPGQRKPEKSGAINGVRRIELLEKVLVNLWVDGGQSLGGSPAPPPGSAGPTTAPPRDSAAGVPPPPAAIAALTGGMGPAAYTAKLLSRALLQIETRGPFAYDSEKNLARFDVVPHSDPNLPNDVHVTKVSAIDGTSNLFSQVLELELNGGPTAAGRPADAPAIKKLHAWTSTPGRYVTVTSEKEAIQSYSQDLVNDQSANKTVLTGAPLYVVRDRNILSAGTPQRAAVLTIEPGRAPPYKQQMTVLGPGRVELFDAASNSTSLTAVWKTSLVQVKEIQDKREQDLFTFTDGAKFEDIKAGYWLKGNELKLWLEPRPAQPSAKAASSDGQAQPSRIQAIGRVTSHSADFDVEQADKLNVYIEDGQTAQAVAAAATAPDPAQPGQNPPSTQPASPSTPNPMAAAGPQPAPEPPKEPEKPKPPMKVKAKDIQTWVKRVPAPAAKASDKPAKPTEPGKPGEQSAGAVKYELKHAVCEDDVTVHQDPTDPKKPRGIDIFARWLQVDGSPDGNIMTVYGWPNRPGEVHQEEMSLIGPKIILDELHNAASVDGRGALTMPTDSDLSGGELKRPEEVVIHWRDKMDFKGALRSAEFVGKVSAHQGQSWVLCHTMHVVFDRPVYFNRAQKQAAPPPRARNPKGPKAAQDDDKPKIDLVRCYPAPADSADHKNDLLVRYQQVEYDTEGNVIKWQQLTAQLLEMYAQARDSAGGETYQLVKADGPNGVLRIWQLGDKDPSGPAPGGNNQQPMRPAQPMQPMQPKQAGAKPDAKDDEQEMKLTEVQFSGRMTAIDKAKVFQKATFTDNIQVINIPAERPDVAIDKYKLPPRALLLTCNKEMVVWTYKKGDAPPAQNMDATGNAYLRSDEYDGWGETITHDGKVVTLTGSEAFPARIMNRFNTGNDQSGKKIIYDRANGRFKVIEAFGGRLGK